jgi:ribosomal protein S24E
LANVTKEQVADVLASKLKAKANAISVFGLKTKFGGGSSSGFALIYDS